MHWNWKPALVAIWSLLTLGVPATLILGALRTYQALEQQREGYLRTRMAAITSRLEGLSPDADSARVLRALEDESGLMNLQVLLEPSGPNDELLPLWQGRELFRTAWLQLEGESVYRAYVPFHAEGRLRLARIDLAANTADFLVSDARRLLVTVAAGSLLIVVLSLATAWSLRRAGQAERRQLELEHLAHLGTLSAVLAHEIRNPLGTIKGFTQLLIEQCGQPQKKMLEPVLAQTIRLEGLVKDLLLYGRPAQPVLRPCSTAEVAAQLQTHWRSMDGGPLPDLVSEVANLPMETDPGLLEQALLNLMRNAKEALDGRSGGRVALGCARRGSALVWWVEDNGPGLSQEAEARLFEPFFTAKASGTGLGLPITRKLVESMGGTLVLQNSEGGGVRAEIRFPWRPNGGANDY